LAADILIVLGALLIGVQGVAMAAQGADGNAVVRQLLLELIALGFVVQHGQLAVWIARIVACSEFHGIDIDALELFRTSSRDSCANKAVNTPTLTERFLSGMV